MKESIQVNFEYRTKRLIFRFYKATDYSEWKRAHSNVRPKKNIWDFDPIPLDDEQILKDHFNSVLKLHKTELKNERGYYFGIFLKKNNYLIGTASLMDISRVFLIMLMLAIEY